jgi:nicotinamide-nucleotide amidase
MKTKRNKVVIVSIGDEILIGQINNTNAVWMAEKLNASGFSTVEITTISDDAGAILSTLERVGKIADLVVVTGGLGPTKDDLTKQTICRFFGSRLVLNEEILEHVRRFFAQRNKELTELNRRQAEVPDNCTPIHNELGTAPGMYFEKEGVHYVFMPGVPFEMKYIMESWVIPEMSRRLEPETIVQKTVLTHGLGESFLAERIAEWENALPPHIKLAYLPSPGRVRLRLRAIDSDRDKLQKEIDEEIEKLKAIIPELIYGYDDDRMEEIIGVMLREKGKTLATAESCTGGYIAHKITEIPGSSDYFLGSVVAYSNEIKRDVLGVSEKDLDDYGAVSEPVIRQMAEGVRRKFGADYALATSGIAGPGGGTPEKPVGTIWIALATPHKTIAKRYQFGEHRIRNINFSFQTAVNMLRMELLGGDNKLPKGF